jgi:hypothetical protein
MISRGPLFLALRITGLALLLGLLTASTPWRTAHPGNDLPPPDLLDTAATPTHWLPIPVPPHTQSIGRWTVRTSSPQITAQTSDQSPPWMTVAEPLKNAAILRVTDNVLLTVAGHIGTNTDLLSYQTTEVDPGAKRIAWWDPDSQRWDPMPTLRAQDDGSILTVALDRTGTWSVVDVNDSTDNPSATSVIGPIIGASTQIPDRSQQFEVLGVSASDPAPPHCLHGQVNWHNSYELTGPTSRGDKPIQWCEGLDESDPSIMQLTVVLNRSYGAQLSIPYSHKYIRYQLPPPLGETLPDFTYKTAPYIDIGSSQPPTNLQQVILLPGVPVTIGFPADAFIPDQAPQSLFTESIQPTSFAFGLAWLVAASIPDQRQRMAYAYATASGAVGCLTLDAHANTLARLNQITTCLSGPRSTAQLYANGLRGNYVLNGMTYDAVAEAKLLLRASTATAAGAASMQLDNDTRNGATQLDWTITVHPAPVSANQTPCTGPPKGTQPAQAVQLGSGQTFTVWKVGNTGGLTQSSLLLTLSDAGGHIFDCKYPAAGEDLADLKCQATVDSTNRCIVAAQVGPHSARVQLVTIDRDTIVPSEQVVSSPTVDILLQDFDDDGLDDIAVALVVENSIYADGRRYWTTYRQRPDGEFQQTGCTPETQSEPTLLASGVC